MIRSTLLTRTRHFCKYVAGEGRRHVVLINCVCLTLFFIKVALLDYSCDYMSPAGMPVNLSAIHLNQFLIEEGDFCHRHSNLSFIVYIHSSLGKVEKRQETRLTWASAGLYDSSVKMAVVFMVGQAKTKEEEIILREESQRYRDIVQGNYTDTYHMLSYKGLASLHWVTKHCSHVPWTIHADDDVLIDIFLLKKFLEGNGTQNGLLCYPWENSPVRRYGKWCVRQNEYEEDIYPAYCAGGAWVVATSLTPKLLEAATRVPVLWVDDVYLTGILSKNAGIPVSSSLKNSVRRDGIDKEDLGKTIVWFETRKPRTLWWYKLLSFHSYVPTIDI